MLHLSYTFGITTVDEKFKDSFGSFYALSLSNFSHDIICLSSIKNNLYKKLVTTMSHETSLSIEIIQYESELTKSDPTDSYSKKLRRNKRNKLVKRK